MILIGVRTSVYSTIDYPFPFPLAFGRLCLYYIYLQSRFGALFRAARV